MKKNPSNELAHLATLLFEWPIKKKPRLSLSLFILIAALLHISTIYLFNIVYQAPLVNKPIAAEVLFLLPGSSSSKQLSAWLEGNDSAIFSPLKTTEAARSKISSDIYQPRQVSLPLRSLPRVENEATAPPFLPTSEIALPATMITVSTDDKNLLLKKISPVSSTLIRLLGKLALRAPLPPSSLGYPELPDVITTPLPPTELTINVDSMGIPRHVIILQSSGNTLADETASHWLMSCHFAPAAEETWGNLLVIWGSSIDQQNATNNSASPQPLNPSTPPLPK